MKHKEIVEFCLANSDESVIKKYSRYFKEGYDSYGIDSKIIRSQKSKWLDSWEGKMTMDDYLNLGDILISTGKFEEADFAIGSWYSFKRNLEKTARFSGNIFIKMERHLRQKDNSICHRKNGQKQQSKI